MLGKLYKHEMKASGHYFLLIYLGVGIATVLATLCYILMVTWNNEFFTTITAPMLLLIAFIAIVILIGGTALVNIYRFYRSMVSEEGYLTHTLPVNVHQLINSKMLVALTFELLRTLAVIVLTIYSLFLYAVFTNDYSFASLLLKIQKGFSTFITESYGINILVFGIEMIIAIIVGSIFGLLMIYLSFAIGQTMKTHKFIWSTVSYVGITMVYKMIVQIITAVIMVVITFSYDAVTYKYFSFIDSNPGAIVHPTMVISILFSIIGCVICYILTHYLFTKKLNLE